ncbi:Rieske (2Fe-2S) protein [Methanosarcina sp. Mfa9]|uniref:Rieske (2Fe-2S) protein n=1 Tax=Methanosarcina sp. Mfa9 TaxID=3439063 RepID=UPI003F83BD64
MISDKTSGKISGTSGTSGFEPPWHYAAEESGLKEGILHLVELEGKGILFIKMEGKIYAFLNTCPHARCPLDRGVLEDHELKCICHGRRFDIRTGECLNDSLELKKVEWKLEGGKIGVKVEE